VIHKYSHLHSRISFISLLPCLWINRSQNFVIFIKHKQQISLTIMYIDLCPLLFLHVYNFDLYYNPVIYAKPVSYFFHLIWYTIFSALGYWILTRQRTYYFTLTLVQNTWHTGKELKRNLHGKVHRNGNTAQRSCNRAKFCTVNYWYSSE